jgi:hypothetical protein
MAGADDRNVIRRRPRGTHRSVPLKTLRRYCSSSTITAPPATRSPSVTYTARTVAS